MHCAIGRHLEYVNVSAARFGGIECDADCSLDVGRVFNSYEYELARRHHASQILSLSRCCSQAASWPFDRSRAMGGARHDQQRSLVSTQKALGR